MPTCAEDERSRKARDQEDRVRQRLPITVDPCRVVVVEIPKLNVTTRLR